jgi:phytoene synthase
MADDLLKASYAACRCLVRGSGSNFARCLWLLPPSRRKAMEALYAFLRITDDLADQAGPAFRRQAALQQWRRDLDEALREAGIDLGSGFEIAEVMSKEFFPASGEQMKSGPAGRGCPPATPEAGLPSFGPSATPELAAKGRKMPVGGDVPGQASQRLEEGDEYLEGVGRTILPAVADTVRQFQIPPVYLYAVFEGVGMDVAGVRYETFEQLSLYCRRVASAVGLACLCIWDAHRPQAIRPAMDCGLAFQLTNILRDLKEDARLGRVYLPAEDLAVFGYSPDDFPPAQPDERFDRLILQQAERAQQFYHQAAELWNHLDRAGQRIFGIMYQTYRRLLDRIVCTPRIILAERVRLGAGEKLGLTLRWTLWPSRRWLS